MAPLRFGHGDSSSQSLRREEALSCGRRVRGRLLQRLLLGGRDADTVGAGLHTGRICGGEHLAQLAFPRVGILTRGRGRTALPGGRGQRDRRRSFTRWELGSGAGNREPKPKRLAAHRFGEAASARLRLAEAAVEKPNSRYIRDGLDSRSFGKLTDMVAYKRKT